MSALTKKLSLFLAIFLLLVMAVVMAFYFLYQGPLQSVLSKNSQLQYLQEIILPKREDKMVLGFLPYWNLTTFTLQPELKELAYFSLTITADGNLLTRSAPGETEPGYNKLQSDEFLEISNAALTQGSKLQLVFSQFDNDDIAAFLRNEKAQLNFYQNLDSLLAAYNFSGINIDIEYSGEVDQSLRDGYSTFLRKLDWYLANKYPNVSIGIDVYASAAAENSNSIWDIPALEPYVDQIIVMAYDFHSKVSTQAGPVAPLFSEEGSWKTDINQHLKEFLDQVDRKKILLGIPFYGYGWQTDSKEANANTYPKTGFTVSYQKAKELLGQSPSQGTWDQVTQVKTGWDENALSPYISYQEDGENYLIYYENPQSLSYKLEYAKQLNLAGIAIWALGYEGSDRDLWEVIQEKL